MEKIGDGQQIAVRDPGKAGGVAACWCQWQVSGSHPSILCIPEPLRSSTKSRATSHAAVQEGHGISLIGGLFRELKKKKKLKVEWLQIHPHPRTAGREWAVGSKCKNDEAVHTRDTHIHSHLYKLALLPWMHLGPDFGEKNTIYPLVR